MHLHVWFIQRKERYPGQYAPEARLVADEFTMEESPEYLSEAIEKEKKLIGDDIAGDAVVVLDVHQQSIRNRCLRASSVLRVDIVPEEPKA